MPVSREARSILRRSGSGRLRNAIAPEFPRQRQSLVVDEEDAVVLVRRHEVVDLLSLLLDQRCVSMGRPQVLHGEVITRISKRMTKPREVQFLPGIGSAGREARDLLLLLRHPRL